MRLGTGSANGRNRRRSASTCSPSRPRCAPTRAASVEDEELWGITGLLHDLDYERHPVLETGIRARAARARAARLPARAGARRGVARRLPRRAARHPMEQTLYAVDELSGFIMACAYVRPDGHPRADAQVRQEEDEDAGVRRRRGSRRAARGRRGARRGLRRAPRVRHRRARGAGADDGSSSERPGRLPAACRRR